MRIEKPMLDNFRGLKTQNNVPINSSSDFKDILKGLISDVSALEKQNKVNNEVLATGQSDSLENIMIDMEKADIALQFTLQVRNKILEAYQEIMRMQV